MSGHDYSRRQGIVERLSADERALRLAAFRSILARTPASLAILVERTALAPEAAASALARLVNAGLIARNEAGDVVGSWGLTPAATSHRLQMRGEEYHTWCAEDAVGIPAALGADATVTSTCFHCSREVVVEIARGEVTRALPPDTCLWLAEAEIGRSMVGCT